MRELSANEMEVWLYDVKRNLQVSWLCDVIERDFFDMVCNGIMA